MEIDKSHIDTVEYGISPPMKIAVTLPIINDGKDTGIVIYIASSPFRQTPGAEFIAEIAKKLTLAANQ